MLKHVFKLTWNRRRANALVVIEVAAAFLVLFVLAGSVYHNWKLYQSPLGFHYRDVWEVGLSIDGGWSEADGTALADALESLRALPGVVDAHANLLTPFRNSNWMDRVGPGDRTLVSRLNTMTDDAPVALDMELVEGRWFGPEDSGQSYHPVVINRFLRNEVFDPGESPLGIDIRVRYEDDEDDLPYRVVGVFEDFRQRGEFFELMPYVIHRHDLEELDSPVDSLFVRVAPGTSADFEEDVLQAVLAVAPTWSVTVTPWSRLRDLHHDNVLTPLKIFAIIAGFMLVMVALGLIGVLWQDVIRRTQEIGLRRALGAPAPGVRRQVVLEMIVVALFGIAVGSVFAVQLPMLELIDQLDWATTPIALAAAAALVLVLVMSSALYPSWLATRHTPAEALRYE